MDARILTVGEPGDGQTNRVPTIARFKNAFARVPALSHLRFSPELRKAALAGARQADIIHSHGLWLMPNVYAGQAARAAGKPLVVSPRGMLAPEALRYSRLKKRIFWTLLQRRAYAGAAWHATSAAEADDIRAFGQNGPIAIIPNGVDLPVSLAAHDEAAPRRRLLFLSRLHPKKGLPNLVEAWAQVAPERPDWDLTIAGPDEDGHQAALQARASARSARNIQFPGATYGAAKDALVASADLFVLPTENENFGIAVAEALAAGVPAIVTKGAPWAGLRTEGCGWWIDHGAAPLVAALREATALPAPVRRDMGLRGRAWMERDFGWDRIGRDMADYYRWLIARGDRPTFVQTF